MSGDIFTSASGAAFTAWTATPGNAAGRHADRVGCVPAERYGATRTTVVSGKRALLYDFGPPPYSRANVTCALRHITMRGLKA